MCSKIGGEMSYPGGGNVRGGEMSGGEMSGGKCPGGGKCPFTELR
jgi:hypothetical protein